MDRTEVIDTLLNAGDYKEAERFANSVEDEWQRAESLAQIARAFIKSGQFNEAQRVWKEAVAVAQIGEENQSLQDSIDSSSVLWEVAEDMALVGAVENAYKVATAIKHDWKRKRTLDGLAEIEKGGKGSFNKLFNK